MPRREHLTILIDTLRELERAGEGTVEVSLTRVAARVNVPFDRLHENIRELQLRGLVTGERPYRPTPYGAALLRKRESWENAVAAAGLTPTYGA